MSARHVDRCPICGAWRYRKRCDTPHNPHGARVETVQVAK